MFIFDDKIHPPLLRNRINQRDNTIVINKIKKMVHKCLLSHKKQMHSYDIKTDKTKYVKDLK